MANHNKSIYGKKSKEPRAINLSGCTLVPNEVLDYYLPLLSEIELKTLLILLQAQTFPQVNFRGLTINDIQQHLASKSESVMQENKYSENKIKQAVDYLIQLGLLTSKEIEDTNIFRYYINLNKEAAEETSQEEKKTNIQPPLTELETGEEGRMDIEAKLTKDLNEEENKLKKERIVVEDVKETPKPEATKEKPESEKAKEVEKMKKAPLTEAVPLLDIQARLKSDLEKEVNPEEEKKKEEEKKVEPKEKPDAKEEEKIMAEVAAEKAEKQHIAEEKKGKDTWKTILEKSADILDTFTFQQWLAPTQYKGYKNGVHLISVPSKTFYSWFDKEFKDILDDAIMEIDPDFKYKFISGETEN
jgi:hypothetical protein